MTGWVLEVEQKTREEEVGGGDSGDYLSDDCSGVFSGMCACWEIDILNSWEYPGARPVLQFLHLYCE